MTTRRTKTRWAGLPGIGLLAGLIGCAAMGAHAADTRQAALDRFADRLGYRFTVVTNHAATGCAPGQTCFESRISLTLPQDLPDGNWSLYVSLVARMTAASDAFDVTHINGDLYRLTPKPGVVLRPGQTYDIPLLGAGHFFSAYYAMPNAYVAEDGLKARIVAATRAAVDPSSGQEILPFVTPLTDAAALQSGLPTDQTRWLTPERLFAQTAERASAPVRLEFAVLPAPVMEKHLGGAALDLKRGVSVTLHGFAPGDVAVALGRLHVAPRKGVALDIGAGQGMTPESYRLVASGNRIRITAADAAGAAYALDSLVQQAAFEHDQLRPIEIDDAPRFGFRGLHLDLARNFRGKAYILKTIRLMGLYKLNTLHLHLGDDEGWRLAIDGLPELTEIGSRRCYDPAEDHCLLPQLGSGPDAGAPVNGYLSRADYIEILKAAKANHIEVIPSFDMPGHSRAAVRSMEARYRRLMAAGQPEAASAYRLADPGDKTVYSSIQMYDDNTINVCLPSAYAFVGKVIDTIDAMHKEAGLPLRRYHIGTDETAGAWKDSPACQAEMASDHLTADQLGTHFVVKVSQMLAGKGIEPAGWSDGMGHADPAQMPKTVQSNSWGMLLGGGIADAHRQANQGWQIVMSSPEVLYFDMPYAPDPLERGYDWASRGTDLFKVFAFMPQNLPANGSLMQGLDGKGVKVADTTPLTAGHGIAGMQGQLWSESVRSDAIADYMLYPRVLALAERAWHRGGWEPDYVPGKSYSYDDASIDRQALLDDWQGFEARVTLQLGALEREGVAYRIPVPGARIENGVLEANSAITGLPIEYRTGGGWLPYNGPVQVGGATEVRTLSPDGRRVSRTITVQPSV